MKNSTFRQSGSRSRRTRKRGTARLFVLGAAFAASTTLTPAAASAQRASGDAQVSQDAAAVRFQIPEGPLREVAAAFAAATGIRVVLALDGIGEIMSPGVSGAMTPRQALERLLMGTSVGATFTEAGAVTLGVQTSAFVVVEGEAPGVSSPKFTAPLRDTPQTITVVPSSVIQAQGATTLRDILRNVTGISIQAGEGGVPAGDNLTIRGFSARTDFFIDGVRDSGGYTRDPFNVEQVEVIKGPSSSYAGRGSTGGAVNMATKAPHETASRAVSVGIGSSEFRRGTFDVNQPLDDSTAVRVNAMWTDTETPGRDAITSRRWGIAPSLGVGIGTPTRVTLSYAHLDQRNLPDYGIPWVPASNEALAAYANQPAPVDFRNFYGLTARDYEGTFTDTATVEVERDLGAVASLRSLARYGRTRRDSLITAPRFESNASTAIRRTDWKSRDQADAIVASQTDLTSRFESGTLGHTVVAGVEFTRETSVNWARDERGPTPPSTDLFAPTPGDPYASRLVRSGAVNDALAHSAAVYAFDTVDVSGRVQLNGGLRFDRFSLDYLSRNAAGDDTRLDRTDDMLSWRAGAVFKPRPEGSVYAGVGTSLNPSTEGLSVSANTVEVDPERTRSYEVGVKWDAFGGRLGTNAAAFRTEKSNARTPGLNPGDPPTVLDGEHVVSGLEAGVNGRVTPGWQVFAGYTFMTSDITRSNNASEVGHEFGNTPRHSLSVWNEVQLAGGVAIGGGAQYVGDRFNNNSQTRMARAYWVFDAMAAYRLSDRLTLRLNGLNLADERYIDRVGGGHFIPGPGRSVALTMDVGF